MQSFSEARSIGLQTAFLCHSHKDQTLALGLRNLLLAQGWKVYIDWLDQELPDHPDKNTAIRIRDKISSHRWFLFLATASSVASRWCPWEIGYADAIKNNDSILLVRTEDDNGRWYGNEYLQLYRQINEAKSSDGKRGYAVFAPSAKNGGMWLGDLK
ncbi:MAG: TIR domain-containing protein [Cyanobacteriota bacterium]